MWMQLKGVVYQRTYSFPPENSSAKIKHFYTDFCSLCPIDFGLVLIKPVQLLGWQASRVKHMIRSEQTDTMPFVSPVQA